MTLVFIHWGEYAGFKHALACARARAGCPITVISDQPAPPMVQHIPIAAFPNCLAIRQGIAANTGAWASYSLARWFILRDLALINPSIFPVFCADWDVMIFRDLHAAYAPFLDCDYTVSRVVEGGMGSAAYGVNRIEPLMAYCKLVAKINGGDDDRAKALNDMEAWSLVGKGQWNVGDLHQVVNGAVFDHSMHAGEDRFIFNGPSKDVVFDGGYPYFLLKDGTRIAANTMHCWGTYKERTGQMREHAGIPL